MRPHPSATAGTVLRCYDPRRQIGIYIGTHSDYSDPAFDGYKNAGSLPRQAQDISTVLKTTVLETDGQAESCLKERRCETAAIMNRAPVGCLDSVRLDTQRELPLFRPFRSVSFCVVGDRLFTKYKYENTPVFTEGEIQESLLHGDEETETLPERYLT